MRKLIAQMGLIVAVCGLLLPRVIGAAANDVPPEVSDHAQEWPLPNQSYDNARNAVSSIIAANVDSLKPAWSFPIPAISRYGAAATNPLIIGGAVYFQDLASSVYALDLDDGHVLWQHAYNLPTNGPNGIAAGWGKIFASVVPNILVALDAQSGSELWRTPLSANPNEGINVQPLPYANKVLISTVPNAGLDNAYKPGARGIIIAVDQQTGAVAWQFDTIESPDLWGHPEVNSGGGAWFPPAVDPESGLTFWGVGNPAPFPGTQEFPNGSSRPGANLYTNSLVALGLNDGKLAWYQQVKPHDLFDLDFQLSPILTRANIGGVPHNLVVGGGKVGVVYAFDRATGDIVWSASVGRHQNDQAREVPVFRHIAVYPGIDGGIETPMALAGDGTLYLATINSPMIYADTRPIYRALDRSAGKSDFVAMDARTGAILWVRPFDDLLFGGATVVNDLVFTAGFKGTIYALDRASGEIVWQVQTPGGINGWPAIVGDTIVWPVGVGSTPTLLALRLSADA